MTQFKFSAGFKQSIKQHLITNMLGHVLNKYTQMLDEIIQDNSEIISGHYAGRIIYNYQVYSHSNCALPDYADKDILDESLYPRMEAYLAAQQNIQNDVKAIEAYMNRALVKCSTIRDLWTIFPEKISKHLPWDQLEEYYYEDDRITLSKREVDSFNHIEESFINKIDEILLADQLLL